MSARVVLMAGPIAVGKTVTAEILSASDLTHVRVRQALADVLGEHLEDRESLQRRGAELDRRTSGLWLRDYLQERIEAGTPIVVDSLRTRRQAEPLLTGLDSCLIYLRAHESIRRRRYEAAAETDAIKRRTPFDSAMRHPTETAVTDLIPLAHHILDTDAMDVDEVASVILSALDD